MLRSAFAGSHCARKSGGCGTKSGRASVVGVEGDMRIVCRHAALLVALAGCYNPATQEGAPCDNANGCPIPQRCVVGRCSLRDAPAVDASPPEPDAPPD